MRHTFSYIFPLILSLSCSEVISAGWDTTLIGTVREKWTDNVSLETGSNKESDLVTEVSPRLIIERDRGRIQGSLDYQAQGFVYKNNSGDNNLFHELNSLASGEIIENIFFIDAAATYEQQVIDPEESQAFDNSSITDNRTNVGTYTISPYLVKDLGRTFSASARYARSAVRYGSDSGNDDLSDSDLDSVELAIGSRSLVGGRSFWGGQSLGGRQLLGSRQSQSLGTRRLTRGGRQSGTGLSGALRYTGIKVSYDDDTDDKFHRGGAELGYRFSPKFELLGIAGYEKYDTETDDQSSTPDGFGWEVGFAWDPRPRDHVEVGVGRRFFGATYRFQWLHLASRYSTVINYRDTVESDATLLTGNALTGDTSGTQSQASSGGANDTASSNFRSTDEIFVRRYLDTSITYRWSKVSADLAPYFERREYEFSGTDKYYGVTTGARWRFKPRTSLVLTLFWSREKYRDSDNEDDIKQARIGLDHSLGPRTAGSLEYSYTKQDSNDIGSGYTENAVTVSLTRVFGRRKR